MHIATILLLSLSSNLDNLGIGVSYGIRKVNVPFTSNLLIAFITSCGTLISLVLGRTFYLLLSPSTAVLLGGFIIIAAGLWVIFQQGISRGQKEPRRVAPNSAGERLDRCDSHLRQIINVLNDPIEADVDVSGDIDLREAGVLALGLTINNVPNGVGAGMLGLSAPIMTLAVFVASIIMIWMGLVCGRLGSRRLGNSAGLISGLLLVLIGVWEIFSGR